MPDKKKKKTFVLWVGGLLPVVEFPNGKNQQVYIHTIGFAAPAAPFFFLLLLLIATLIGLSSLHITLVRRIANVIVCS